MIVAAMAPAQSAEGVTPSTSEILINFSYNNRIDGYFPLSGTIRLMAPGRHWVSHYHSRSTAFQPCL